jgi:hypothetical protein
MKIYSLEVVGVVVMTTRDGAVGYGFGLKVACRRCSILSV